MNQPIRLSISEAARLFGMNQITIRRAIKEGKLSYVVVRGRYQLNFESVLKWSQESARTKNKLESAGIGQYVNQWRIKNPLYSPNPKLIEKKEDIPNSWPSRSLQFSGIVFTWGSPIQSSLFSTGQHAVMLFNFNLKINQNSRHLSA